MPVVREAYLTSKQMERIGIPDASAVYSEDMKEQKRAAAHAAKELCENPYFPLYEESDMSSPAAYYFTGEGVIIPAGDNALKKKIYDEWRHLMPGQTEQKYLSASNDQTARLHTYLNQFLRSNGTVKEPSFSFLRLVDYLLFREGADWKYYKIICWRPGSFKGFPLPVWCYPLAGGEDFLDSWVRLCREYGLVPNAEEILAWLQDLPGAETVDLTMEQYQKLKKHWREADLTRLGSKYYCLSEGVFNDGRCWEVFENAQASPGKIRCVFPEGEWLIADEPLVNIVKGGMVSIDFGTKNTVVVISDQPNSYYTLKSKNEHTEGDSLYPTVLKFCSLEKFLEAYESECGRPETCWETLSIDGSAHEGGSSDSALGIFRGLKQWMMDPGSKDTILRQKGAPDKPIVLSEYASDNNRIDPIELYAYYLGLYINNNQDNKIFMRYRLSFSVTCREHIRRKMNESFRRGLMKSLPSSIVNSKRMEDFIVDCTCTEPAAYAVCALACMGMPAQCQDYFFYGIFDFGGGTCDFNYGIWGLEEDHKLHRKKYKIWMLGDGGDPFLGGENLLELLAVQVCMDQRAWFRDHGFKISRPRCYEGGNEDFFAASFEAQNNLECLVDQLRAPIWERPDDRDQESGEFEILVSGLIPERGDGSHPVATELKLSRRSLEKLILSRIDEGVSAFFNTCYQILEEQGKKEVPQLCVFLAGNSCRSKWVRVVFDRYIREELDHRYIKNVYLCDPMGSPEFVKHIPSALWDEDQIGRMESSISRLGDLDGKTGVAYGLALYGELVEIEDISVKNSLSYYLGTRSFFGVDVLRGAHGDRLAIGESVPFAASAVCDLYYTRMIPKGGVLTGVKTIMLNGQQIPALEDMTCFVRADSQTEISIFAVSGDDPEKHDPEEELVVDLQTGRFRKTPDFKKKG